MAQTTRAGLGLHIFAGIGEGAFDESGVGGGGVDDAAAGLHKVADSRVVAFVPLYDAALDVDDYILPIFGVQPVEGFVLFLRVLCFHNQCFFSGRKSVAPMYNELPVTLRVKRGEKRIIFTSEAKVTEWLPGENNAEFTVELPFGTEAGEWEMALAIGGGEKPFVTLANEIERDGAYHKIGKVSVG